MSWSSASFIKIISKLKGYARPKVEYGPFRQSKASNSNVNNPVEPIFEFLQDFMYILVICKFHKDPLKTEGGMPVTKPNMGCFGTQGQITLT